MTNAFLIRGDAKVVASWFPSVFKTVVPREIWNNLEMDKRIGENSPTFLKLQSLFYYYFSLIQLKKFAYLKIQAWVLFEILA